MKKIFTLIAAAMISAVSFAQTTLIDFPTSATGIKVSGTTTGDGTTATSVKVHANTDKLAAYKLANGYVNENVFNDNAIVLSVDGGFKTGDVVTIAGATSIAEADEATKSGAVKLVTVDEAKAVTELWSSSKFVNGKISSDDPVAESYTLTADASTLYIVRNGNTSTYVTTIKVVRGGQTDGVAAPVTVSSNKVVKTVKEGKVVIEKNGKTFNAAGVLVK